MAEGPGPSLGAASSLGASAPSSLGADKAPKPADGAQPGPSAGEMQAALVQIHQMLALLDLPLTQGRMGKPQAGMHEGIIYGLRDMLAPLDAQMRVQGTDAQSLAAAIRGQEASQALDSFVSNANTMIHMSKRLSSMLQDSTPGVPEGQTALDVVHAYLRAHPLTETDENEVLQRLRHKRRRIPHRDAQRGEGGRDSAEPGNTGDAAGVANPFHPVPRELVFAPTTPWLGDVCAQTLSMQPYEAIAALVHAFNESTKRMCHTEALVLVSPTARIAMPTNRVRARIAAWSSATGELHVEIRDVALVSIGLRVSPECHATGMDRTLMPSRFALYDDLGNHLFIQALHHTMTQRSYIEALGRTLMHIAALRTLYDSQPLPETPMESIPARVTAGQLLGDGTHAQTRVIAWKWCKVAAVDTSAPAQGEWCAFLPCLL
ncbi:hypothetical protein MSPP1_001250 [Malassezia sp. CBS 17886]|nr:hypothetical protein MSPP1_001250 [Malassezia sp. CBS 17886]